MLEGGLPGWRSGRPPSPRVWCNGGPDLVLPVASLGSDLACATRADGLIVGPFFRHPRGERPARPGPCRFRSAPSPRRDPPREEPIVLGVAELALGDNVGSSPVLAGSVRRGSDDSAGSAGTRVRSAKRQHGPRSSSWRCRSAPSATRPRPRARPCYTPFLQQAFSTEALARRDWPLCAATGSSVLWLSELGKALLRSRRHAAGHRGFARS